MTKRADKLYKEASFSFGGLVARNIDHEDKANVSKVHHLRHEVFAKKLAWVPTTEDEYERDEYDKHSIFFGVFRDEELLGTARLTLHKGPFMLDKAFKYLLAGKSLKHTGPDTVELSRLGTLPSLEDKKTRRIVAMCLYKLLYEWSLKNGVRYWYLVTTERYLKSLQNHLRIPIEKIGGEHNTEDGELYSAALIDLDLARKSMGLMRYIFFRWLLK